MSFAALNVPSHLVDSLARMQITNPTPIQTQAIPLGLDGRDLLASAQTGTGKTIAYLIPLLARLSESNKSTALILTPTRELATQVRDSLNQILGRKTPFSLALLIGGEDIRKQFNQLRCRPRLIIGTPGRVIDHLKRSTLNLDETKFLVLDETDRMLDMGFHEQLKEMAEYLPDERQTFMFSATMPDNITKLAHHYLNDPMRIAIGSSTKPIEKIHQQLVHTTNPEKFPLLLRELDSREGSIIVFVKTKRGADELVLKLKHKNHEAEAIHGDLRQHKRDRVIREFRNKKHRIMVATDIAARGLDVPHVEHVVNYDLPQCPEDYIHRIGRTGRAGAVGQAITLISPQEGSLWRMIHKLMTPDKPCDLPSGYDIEPRGRRGKRPQASGGKKPFWKKGGSDRPGRSERADRPERSERTERSERSDRPSRSERSDRPGRSDRSDRPGRADKPNRPYGQSRRKATNGDMKSAPHGERTEGSSQSPRRFGSDRPTSDGNSATGKRKPFNGKKAFGPSHKPRGKKPASKRSPNAR